MRKVTARRAPSSRRMLQNLEETLAATSRATMKWTSRARCTAHTSSTTRCVLNSFKTQRNGGSQARQTSAPAPLTFVTPDVRRGHRAEFNGRLHPCPLITDYYCHNTSGKDFRMAYRLPCATDICETPSQMN
jgi:hypothetical protein